MRSRFVPAYFVLAGFLYTPLAAFARNSERYELLGVIADSSHSDKRRSVALLKDTSSKRVLVARLGDEIAPHVRVLRIAPKQVLVGREGQAPDTVVASPWASESNSQSSERVAGNEEGMPYFGSDETPPMPPPPPTFSPPYDPNMPPPPYDSNMPPPSYDPNMPAPPPYDPNMPPDQHVFGNAPNNYYPNDGLHNNVPGSQYDNWQDPNWGHRDSDSGW